MSILRRVPEVDREIANHLKQIDINGWPKNYETAKRFERYINYGWVSKGGTLTQLGEQAMNSYFDQAAKDRMDDSPYNRVQPSARG
jgi:hypothetical protein